MSCVRHAALLCDIFEPVVEKMSRQWFGTASRHQQLEDTASSGLQVTVGRGLYAAEGRSDLEALLRQSRIVLA